VAEYALGIDIGGTFTDSILVDVQRGAHRVAKTLTTYPDPSVGVLEGLRGILEREQARGRTVARVIHGTTLVTNTLIERKGARTGLMTTEGFRDALEIGREGRYDIYDLRLELPEPLVERRFRLGVPERLNPDGSVRVPIDTKAVDAVCDRFSEAGIEAIGVCLLHAYANPDHENAVLARIRERLPDCAVTLSSDVAPELREFERTSTTVANAYVQPLVRRYLKALEDGIEDLGISAPLHVMLSNGGSCSVDAAQTFPVRLVESGPCGGALAAVEWGRRSGHERVLAFDMGGTTAKAVLSVGGDFPIATESEVARVYRFKRGSGLPLLVPVLDMIEIGAGGGSIARTNTLGLPAVGPESAGSTPGPACYGRGGEDPTVTDADLVLGYLDPGYFLGGEMPLSLAGAQAAIERVATSFGEDVTLTALGIHDLVNENMANAARVHAAERGADLRAFALVATGGAGPVHACGVASRLGLEHVVIPPVAGVGSAFGLLLAPISFDYARSYVSRIEEIDLARLSSLLDEMEQDGRVVVEEAGVSPEDVVVERHADVRYVGQGHEVRVRLPDAAIDRAFGDRLVEAFEAAYAKLFGRACEGVPIEAVHWRTTVRGPAVGQHLVVSNTQAEPVKGTRQAVFDRSGPVETTVYDRYALPPGKYQGPAVIEEAESTAVVPPNWEFEMTDEGTLVLTKVAS